MSNIEKEARKKIRRAAINKNWTLFKQSRLGIVGLGIVLFFAFLAVLQPILFLTGVWNEGVYDPVVGYEPERFVFQIYSHFLIRYKRICVRLKINVFCKFLFCTFCYKKMWPANDTT